MIFNVGNLIVLLLVLAMFLAYHRLTLDNRSLEKLKKMGERLSGELGAYADRRADDLKSYGIELDVHQQAAKVALDKLAAVQSAIAERAESIGDIEKRLSDYDDVLKKLIDMTARVDENLRRVEEQGNFAMSVNRKLDAAHKSIDAVERELPLLREGFASDARQAVDSFKEDVLAQVHDGLDETAATLQAARAESLEALRRAESARAAMDEGFAQALAGAGEKAAALEDEAFRKMKENAEIKAARMKDQIEERFAALGQDARTMASGVRESIEAFRGEWEAEAKSLLDETIAKLGQASVQADAAVKAADEALRRSGEELETVARSMEEQGGILSRRMDEESARAIGEGAALFDARMKEYEASASERMSRLEEDNRTLAGLKAGIEELKASSWDRMSGKITEFEDGLFTGLEAKRSEILARLDAWSTELDMRVEAVTTEAMARRTAEEDAYMDQMRARIAENQEKFAAQLDKLTTNFRAIQDGISAQADLARGELEALKESLRKDAQDSRALAMQKVGDVISQLGLESSEALESARKDLTGRLDRLGSEIAAEEERMDSELRTIRDETGALREQSAQALVEAEERFRIELDSFSVSAKNLVERARDEYETQRDSFERASLADRERISSEIAALSDIARNRTADAAATFERAASGMQASLEAMRVQTSGKFEGENARLIQALATLDKDQKTVLSQIKVFGEAETLRARLEASLDSLKKDIARVEARKSEITDIESQMNRIRRLDDEINQRLTRFTAEKRRIEVLEQDFEKLSATAGDVDRKFETLAAQSATVADLQARLQRLSDIAKDAEAKSDRRA